MPSRRAPTRDRLKHWSPELIARGIEVSQRIHRSRNFKPLAFTRAPRDASLGFVTKLTLDVA